MSKILTPTTSPLDWKSLLADPEKHWRWGYSAMSAALTWEAAKGLPAEIAAIFGPDTELLLAIPEHQVPMPGRGRAVGRRHVRPVGPGRTQEPVSEREVPPNELRVSRVDGYGTPLGVGEESTR